MQMKWNTHVQKTASYCFYFCVSYLHGVSLKWIFVDIIVINVVYYGELIKWLR